MCQALTPRKALFGSAIGYAMDGFDLLIFGFMLGAIHNEHGSHNPQEAMALGDFLKGANLIYHTVVEAT